MPPRCKIIEIISNYRCVCDKQMTSVNITTFKYIFWRQLLIYFLQRPNQDYFCLFYCTQRCVILLTLVQLSFHYYKQTFWERSPRCMLVTRNHCQGNLCAKTENTCDNRFYISNLTKLINYRLVFTALSIFLIILCAQNTKLLFL